MMSQGNFKFIHTQFFSRLIECTTPSFLQGRGGASYQIFKKGGLPESQFLEDDCWEKGGDFFMGSTGGGGGVQFLHK